MKGKRKNWMYRGAALGMASVLMIGMTDMTAFATVSSGDAEIADASEKVSETVSSDDAEITAALNEDNAAVGRESGVWRFDFGTAGSDVQEGWTKISIGDDYLYSGGAEYGWITAPNQTYQYKNTELTGELSGLEAVACDRVRGTDKAYEFAVDVPEGEYEVVVYTGHLEAGTYKFPCTIEGTEMELQEVSEFTAVKYEVTVSDGTLNLIVDERSAAAARVMQGLVITLKKAAEPDEPDVSVAEIIEGEEPTVYYRQSFDDESALNSGLPVGWATAGTISSSAETGERIIKTEGERSYYYLDTKGSDPKYIGKVLTGLSKTGWIEYDFNFIETTSEKYGLGLSCFPSSVNSGNIAIRGTIFPNGDIYFYNGSTNTKIANIKDAGWVHFVYEFNNNKKIYTVKITDAETGEVIGKTYEAFSYNNEKGQVGAFSFSANGASGFGLDEIAVYGYPTPFEFEPEIDPLEQEGKVVLEENENEFILKNDYCKVVIDKKKAVIKKFYTKEGNEILGSSGDGSYLLNYTDSGHIGTSKQEMTLKNCTGRIVRQTDDLCEVSVKEVRLQKGDTEGNVLPIDLEFRFLLKKDSPGLYMYAILSENYSDEDIANGRNFNFGQSRYSIKFDYDRLPYSAIQGGEIDGQLVKMAGPGDFNLGINEATNSSGQLFDSTYVLNDGSIFTKYNNLSYQYCNIMVGAFSDQGGLSLITPSRDWAGGGYAKQDIDVHGGTGSTFLVSWHLETGHNGTKGVDVEEGYQKVYGPVMWYASTDESIDSKEEAYADAYAQALKEIEQWPYSWMAEDTYTNPEDCMQEYAATTRGSLKGTFSVKNGIINTEITNDLTVTDDAGENSIGWAVLSDERSEYWALDNDYYEFYAPIKKDGTFEIDNIIPGTYKLNINVNGVMDEYVQHNIVIGENEVKNLGNIVWDDPIYGRTLWTIGIPDKTAEEYAYAYPCRYWGSHLLFNNLFPNGVDFKIGESKESEDWFFVQMASQTAGHKEHYDGAFYFDDVTKKVKYDASRATAMETDDSRWRGNELATYKIRFDSDTAYEEGTGTLLINVCGNRFGTIRTTLNGENIIDTAARVTVNGGNMTDSKGNEVTNPADTSVVSLYTDGSVGRSGLVGINQLVKIEFDASLIQEGENVIVLTHDHPAYQEDNVTSWENSDYTIYAGNIYDAIRLDVDGKVSSDNDDKADVDKDQLRDAINSAKEINAADYTADSYSVLSEAIANAESVFADENATEEEVNAAIAALQEAIEGLADAVPDEPAEPDEPATPDAPAEPDEPATPDTPAEPDEPATPDAPAEPDEPATPDAPAEPDEPTTPEGPADSDEPSNDDSDASDSSGSQRGSSFENVVVNWSDVYSRVNVAQRAAGSINLNVIAGRELIVPANVTRALDDSDVTLAFHVGNGVAFSLSGREVTDAAMAANINLTNRPGSLAVPEDVLNQRLAGTLASRQISIRDEAPFGMNVNLHIGLGAENAGRYANLYRYNAQTGRLVFTGSFRITAIGQAMFGLSRGGEYLVTVTADRPNETVSAFGDYVVKEGDTLAKIASSHKIRLADLVAANPQIINIHKIYPGQRISLK